MSRDDSALVACSLADGVLLDQHRERGTARMGLVQAFGGGGSKVWRAHGRETVEAGSLRAADSI